MHIVPGCLFTKRLQSEGRLYGKCTDYKMMSSILITGSNRGLGYELVKQLVTTKPPPDFVFAGCRNPERADELTQKHSNVKILKIAVGEEASYQEAVSQVQECVGDRGLNIVFNVAGIYNIDSFHQVTAEKMRMEYEVNCIGPLMITKAFYPLLKKAADTSKVTGLSCCHAAVLNMTSGYGLINGNTSGSIYPYRASKAALNMITKSMSIDFQSDGIMAVAIEPGWVSTDMGGPHANVTPTQCIKAIRELMDRIGEHENGKVVSWRGHTVDY